MIDFLSWMLGVVSGMAIVITIVAVRKDVLSAMIAQEIKKQKKKR